LFKVEGETGRLKVESAYEIWYIFASLRSLKLTASGVFRIIRYEDGLSSTCVTILFLDKIGLLFYGETSSVCVERDIFGTE